MNFPQKLALGLATAALVNGASTQEASAEQLLSIQNLEVCAAKAIIDNVDLTQVIGMHNTGTIQVRKLDDSGNVTSSTTQQSQIAFWSDGKNDGDVAAEGAIHIEETPENLWKISIETIHGGTAGPTIDEVRTYIDLSIEGLDIVDRQGDMTRWVDSKPSLETEHGLWTRNTAWGIEATFKECAGLGEPFRTVTPPTITVVPAPDFLKYTP